MTRPTGRLLRYAAPPLSWPLAWSYAAAVRLKNLAYDRRWVEPQRLTWPVISVGNLSVGGTGKTPMVMLLADRLKERGWIVDVLSRGYGRSSQKVAHVDPLGTVEEFGDEPLVMARRGLPVYVGSHRYQPGRLAEKAVVADAPPSPRLHLLDDGFQHRRLARTIDIVLVQAADLGGHLLPAGRLREPLRALDRAEICVLRAEDVDLDPSLAARVLQQMKRANPNADPGRVWIVERRTTLPLSSPPIAKALAFCAIGDASGFFDGLRETGIEVQETISFRDHHVYTQQDIERLKAAARRSGAQYFLTTEKDGVRLAATLRAELEKVCPVIIAGLEVSLREEIRCIGMLDALLKERLQFRVSNVR